MENINDIGLGSAASMQEMEINMHIATGHHRLALMTHWHWECQWWGCRCCKWPTSGGPVLVVPTSGLGALQRYIYVALEPMG